MTTNEELTLKVESLTERVAMLERVIGAVAAGLSAPRRRRWTTIADGIPPVVAPEPVQATMVILPPQESAEAAERMAATVRKILGAGWPKAGGA